jgi:hypothetical protein
MSVEDDITAYVEDKNEYMLLFHGVNVDFSKSAGSSAGLMVESCSGGKPKDKKGGGDGNLQKKLPFPNAAL